MPRSNPSSLRRRRRRCATPSFIGFDNTSPLSSLRLRRGERVSEVLRSNSGSAQWSIPRECCGEEMERRTGRKSKWNYDILGIPSTRNQLGIPSDTSQSDGSVEYSTRRNVTSMEFHSSQYEYSYNVITSSVRLRKDFHHRGCGAADGAERVARHDARSARGAQTHLCPASSRQTTHFRLRLLTTVPQAVLPPHPPLRHRTPRRSPCVLLLLLSRA